MATLKIYQKGSYANPLRLDPAHDAWRLDGLDLGAVPTLRPPCRTSTAAAAEPRSQGWHGAAPAQEAHGQRGLERRSSPPGRPIQRAPDRPAAQQGGGAGRRPALVLCRATTHTPAPLSPHRWTIMGGQNRVDTDGQGAGWTKCSGWPHRTDRRLTGFSTTWAGCGRRIGSGACRWCPGWDIAGARRLAEEAARGGDERLAWYVPVLEARDRRAPKKNDPAPVEGVERRGRPRADTGWKAYRLKAGGRRTWASIARELGLSDARKGDVALRMAKRHAQREALPWPL